MFFINYKNFYKKIFDYTLSFALLVILIIPMFFISILILLFLGNPVIFKQKRVGFNNKIFTMYKFRTMTNKKNEQGNLLPDNSRMTKFGNFLRETSLDELPEIINVIKGDMSLVGPRPLLVQYLSLYDETQRRRHEMRPGITGWAQVNGRNAINWQQKFYYDVWYVDHVSLSLDFKILLKTVEKVFKREGINSQDNATMEPFQGN